MPLIPHHENGGETLKARNKKITIRLTEHERAYLQEQADAVDLSVEPYMRNLINEVKMKSYPAEERQALLRQVSGIANNCNQIAKHINSGDPVMMEHLAQTRDMVAQIWEKLKEF